MLIEEIMTYLQKIATTIMQTAASTSTTADVAAHATKTVLPDD